MHNVYNVVVYEHHAGEQKTRNYTADIELYSSNFCVQSHCEFSHSFTYARKLILRCQNCVWMCGESKEASDPLKAKNRVDLFSIFLLLSPLFVTTISIALFLSIPFFSTAQYCVSMSIRPMHPKLNYSRWFQWMSKESEHKFRLKDNNDEYITGGPFEKAYFA